MATTLKSDFVIFDELVHTTRVETLQQEVNVFNEASGGALLMEANERRGDFYQESFFKDAINTSRRDPTSNSSATASKMSDDEIVSVKLNRGAGPVQYTADAFRKKGMDPEEASAVIGRDLALEQSQSMLEDSVQGLIAAINNNSGLVYDGTGGPLTFKKVQKGRRQFGDSSQNLTAAIIHGDKFHDLFEDGLDNYKIDEVAGAQIASGDIAGAMGLTFVVTDEPALINTTPSPNTYRTILLSQGGATVEESEELLTANERLTGLENITFEFQAEWAHNLECKGYKFTGSANPTDANLTSTANWAQAVSNDKSTAGVIVQSD